MRDCDGVSAGVCAVAGGSKEMAHLPGLGGREGSNGGGEGCCGGRLRGRGEGCSRGCDSVNTDTDEKANGSLSLVLLREGDEGIRVIEQREE